jgi:hypothetical protein
MKDSCSVLSKLLEKYFDQEVTDEERSFVDVHLVDCHACQEALRSMEKIRGLVKAPVEGAVKKENFPWVWEKIERGIHLQERPIWWQSLRSWLDFFPSFKKRAWIPVVATIAVLLFITTQIFFKKPSIYPSASVVEYIESETNNVMVYDLEDSKVTVIWLFEEPEEGPDTI